MKKGVRGAMLLTWIHVDSDDNLHCLFMPLKQHVLMSGFAMSSLLGVVKWWLWEAVDVGGCSKSA